LTARGRSPEVGITAHEATISLRIVARAATEEECQSQIEDADTVIKDALGDRVFGANETQLEDVVIGQLAKRRWTIAALECGPDACLGSRMLEASARLKLDNVIVRGSVCFPSIEAAHAQLRTWRDSRGVTERNEGDPPELRAAAKLMRTLTHADVCLAVNYPPVSESPSLCPGQTVAIGPDFEAALQPPMIGSPDIQHSRLAKVAVDMLRRQLMRS
jgi:nicotinamide-nucleotide amidase